MKDYKVTNPEFHESITITEPNDPAHADNINEAPKQLYENTLVLKQGVEDAQKAAAAAGGEEYDKDRGYAVGEYCVRDGKMYRCIAPVEKGEEWSEEKWEVTNAAEEIEAARRAAQEAAEAAAAAMQKAEEAESSTVQPTIHVTTYKGATVRCSMGETVFEAEAADGTCSIKVNDFGTWTLETTYNGKTTTRTVEIEEVKSYNVTLKYLRYGYRVKKAEGQPAGRVEYILDAEGMTPAHMDYAADRFDYGDWGDIWFVKNNYPCMLKSDGTEAYKLDPNDYSKREGGVLASDVANTSFDGNAMSAIPLCWVYRYEEDGYQYVIFCEEKYDENYKAYAHTGASGKVQPYTYGPMFKGSLISGKLRSLSGQRPDNNRASDAELTSATANGAGWYIRTHSLNQLVADLMTLISKTDNSQEAFGQGHTDGGTAATSLLTTGGLNTKGQFYGTNTNAAMKAFHMENWYADRWDRILGLILDNGKYKVKMTPEGDGYNLTGAGYDTVATTALSGTNGGYIIDSKQSEYGRLPQGAISGSDSTYECDGCWFNNGIVAVALVGGDCHDGSRCGSRCLAVDNAASHASWIFGASLSYVNPS